jgi:predicted O-methyltransferase YrrM
MKTNLALPIAAAYKLRRVVFDPLAWRLSRRELHEQMKRTDIGEIVDTMDRYAGRGFYASIRAVQARSEIIALASLVQAMKPKVIVEIGTYKGGTLYIWSRSNPQAELFVSIDLPGGQYGGGYAKCRRKLYEEFLYDRRNIELRLIQRDSHEAATLQQLLAILDSRLVDFLFVDGDHTYEGVKRDYEMYGPLVRPGGLIAFHDIETHSHGVEVYKFWAELKTEYKWKEFVDRSNNKGIGVLLI